MEAPNVLIADSNEEFSLALAKTLQERYQVHSCTNGQEALELLRTVQPEILVVDLMLPELDGITLLQTAAQEDLHPTVLATTALVTDYILLSIRQLEIDYVMRKPCDVLATADRVDDLYQRIHPPVFTADPQSYIGELLITMNFLPKHNGYHYLREGIARCAQTPGQSVTKVLYPQIAAVFQANPAHVEHSIRTALSYAWNHRESQRWEVYFPNRQSCPSNAIFISRMAEALRQASAALY